MKIAEGSDHRGFLLKSRLNQILRELGHDVVDVGTSDNQQVDYTDFAAVVSQQVADVRQVT